MPALCQFEIDLPCVAEHSTILKLLNRIADSKSTKNKDLNAIFVFPLYVVCHDENQKSIGKVSLLSGFIIVFSL